ncbi:hypothetical protein [Streptomyces uncialis]|uniref:hypothetical protein n=1 Tax=Streptomyces uncialis TaxID=1048205 RepID=UPI0033C9D4F2
MTDASVAAAGVLLRHATAELPVGSRPGLPLQLHAADPDPFAPPERVAALELAARSSGAALEIFRAAVTTRFSMPVERTSPAPRSTGCRGTGFRSG